MNESCYIWMSHVSYEWVMSHMSHVTHAEGLQWCGTPSCTMSHVTYEWVMSHMNESCHIWMSHVPYEGVMSHTQRACNGMGHLPAQWVVCRMNESCLIWMIYVSYEWVMSRMNESCPLSMSHVTHAEGLQWCGTPSCTTTSHRLLLLPHLLRQHQRALTDSALPTILHWPIRVMFHMNESCHIWMSHVSYE